MLRSSPSPTLQPNVPSSFPRVPTREELRKQADQLKKEIREARKLRERELQDSNAEDEGESGGEGESGDED